MNNENNQVQIANNTSIYKNVLSNVQLIEHLLCCQDGKCVAKQQGANCPPNINRTLARCQNISDLDCYKSFEQYKNDKSLGEYISCSFSPYVDVSAYLKAQNYSISPKCENPLLLTYQVTSCNETEGEIALSNNLSLSDPLVVTCQTPNPTDHSISKIVGIVTGVGFFIAAAIGVIIAYRKYKLSKRKVELVINSKNEDYTDE
ncbi:hypothetical protein F8M41_012355 [Gigaspora margarita]|uniref:Uncharacterized protein n=1 Tax=Gigaspora margarita TaxID=4874 RepID=A0A8H4AT30_GIGMA|nr:hypothetical protein F8M41_012355 [Gigaspora margarita]